MNYFQCTIVQQKNQLLSGYTKENSKEHILSRRNIIPDEKSEMWGEKMLNVKVNLIIAWLKQQQQQKLLWALIYFWLNIISNSNSL